MKMNSSPERVNEGQDQQPDFAGSSIDKVSHRERSGEFDVYRGIMNEQGPPKTDLHGNNVIPEENHDTLEKKFSVETKKESEAKVDDSERIYDGDITNSVIESFWGSIKEAHDTYKHATTRKGSTAEHSPEKHEGLSAVENDTLHWLHQIIPIIEKIIKNIEDEQIHMWSEWKGSKALSPEDPRMNLLSQLRERESELDSELQDFSRDLRIFTRDRNRLEEKVRKAEIYNNLPEDRKRLINKINEVEEEWSNNPEKVIATIRDDYKKKRDQRSKQEEQASTLEV